MLEILLDNLLAIVFIPIIGMFVGSISSYYGYNYTGRKAIANIFQFYNIKEVKQFAGEFVIDEKHRIQIKWNKKNLFIISNHEQVIAKAKASELYWKTLYLSHIMITNKFHKF